MVPNPQPVALARVQQALEGITDARCGNCGHELFGPDSYRQILPELIDALKAEQARLAEWRAQYDDLAAENERLRAHLDAVPSAIRVYAGGELDGYSYHGDGSAIEALRRLSEHAENIRDYAGTRRVDR